MSKLYFKYGTVGSAKTLNLLAIAHSYKQQKKRVMLLKPALDIRFGKSVIQSRAGLKAKADILLSDEVDLFQRSFDDVDCILVDEAQFLSKNLIDQLRNISLYKNIPVICYGLKNDFKNFLFEGSKRLMELADSIEEIKSTCFYCNKKASCNMKYVNNVPTNQGPSVELGCEEKYQASCYACYKKKLREAKNVKKEIYEKSSV